MIREAAAVLILELLLLAVYLRKKHYNYVLAVLPLCLVPAAHLLINLILYATRGAFFGIRPAVVIAFTDLLALAVTCVLVVLVSQRFTVRRSRQMYVIFTLIYSVLLGWAFIFENLAKIIA